MPSPTPPSEENDPQLTMEVIPEQGGIRKSLTAFLKKHYFSSKRTSTVTPISKSNSFIT